MFNESLLEKKLLLYIRGHDCYDDIYLEYYSVAN